MDINNITPQEALRQAITEAEEKVKTATALSMMRSTEGWQILLNTFEEMKNNQLEELSKQRPGDEKAILAAHAVWVATVHAIDQIHDAVEVTIKAGLEAQEFLESLKHTSEDDWP